MKKGLVILMTAAMVFAFAGVALAMDITPETYDLTGKNWNYFEQGVAVSSGGYSGSTGFSDSTHKYGTWNSPYTEGVDGYNYNDAQDSTNDGTLEDQNGDGIADVFTSGPHGGYLTSTHRCRECHAVHRAAGKFKLLRSDTRFEACDWCHGNGAGSGFNIQMDNDDAHTTEYNVGHTMGFGVQSGKWKAPDDTFPAFTPNYWQGGFSCFDCHSPHANPQRMLGYNDAGSPVGLWEGIDNNGDNIVDPKDGDTVVDTDGDGIAKVYSIVNSGHDLMTAGGKNYLPASLDPEGAGKARPWYIAGSWLLIKNPDREIASVSTTVASGITGEGNISISAGSEIPDVVDADLYEFDTDTPYPVNKIVTDWNTPMGLAKWAPTQTSLSEVAVKTRNGKLEMWVLDEFCADCHDGNAGFHTRKAPLFSEDRALRDQATSYDLAFGHDANVRHCGRQMRFNPEDNLLGGPRCRNCHKGASSCGTCHSTATGKVADATEAQMADNTLSKSPYLHTKTTTGATGIDSAFTAGQYKKSRTVAWNSDWRTTTTAATAADIDAICSDDGFSWPHRTLGWKMLKDDLFGLNFDGTEVAAGGTRTYGSNNYTVHDLDSVCLDCHNPTIWNSARNGDLSHVDDLTDPTDDKTDELLLRGLP